MRKIIWLHFPTTIRVEVQGWQWCILVNVLVKEAVLITKDTGVLPACNFLQFQNVNIQTDVSESRVASDNSPSLGLLETLGAEGVLSRG